VKLVRLVPLSTAIKLVFVTNTTTKILYADDDCDDCFLLNESIKSNGLNADLVFVANGQEAITYIEHAAEALPSLVILDLNMPKMNGRETLHYLKTHPRYQNIPVIILSTSQNKKEMDDCAAQGAVSYFVKPNHMNGYDSIVKACRPFLGEA
jgi:CheY-like chemotaxis protein